MSDIIKAALFVVMIVVFIGFGIYWCISYKDSAENITIEVTGKERVTSSDGDGGVDSKYLVFTKSETFENTDSYIFGKYNSSDIQGMLRDNREYIVMVAGWRTPILSKYRNIIYVITELKVKKVVE